MAKTIGFILLVLLWGVPFAAMAQETERFPRGSEIYGRELMTPQERDTYRERMWDLRTEVERERFRRDHRRRMQDRAAQRRIALPEDGIALDRPFFEREPLPAGSDDRRLRDDGLRRRTAHEEPAANVLRRWSSPPSAESRGDGLRRLPEQFRHEEAPERTPRRIPGAGRMGGN